MNKQELYVINSLSGKSVEFVTQVMAVLPDLIKAVEESGWIEIDENNQPPTDTPVQIWNADAQEQMVGRYIPRFSICTDDQSFTGDTEYNEETDLTYWPEGWYLFSEHWTDYTYHLTLDNITHYKPLVTPSFLKGQDGEA